MPTVHLRITDAATRQPTPVCLRVSAADGTSFAPFGRAAEFPVGRYEDVGGHLLVGRDRWYYVDGSCEISLPAGVPLRVEVSKGPEYRPRAEAVTLGPGQLTLRYAVERWSDLAADGWVAGDSRCHSLTPHDALLEAAAEDLAVVNLLACVQPWPSLDGKAYTTIPNMTAFSGQRAALEAGGRLVAVNTLNAHPTLGRLGLLHGHRPVFPLTFGGDDDTDDWSLGDWCDQCHRKRGLVVWVDAFRPDAALVGGEGLVAALLGQIDAIEVDARPRPQPLLPWVYKLWNCGLSIPLVGGSGKESNRVRLGATRTYARVLGTEPGAYSAWVEAVRASRTFVTNGPLLALAVNGQGPGARLDFSAEKGQVVVAAAAQSLHPFEKLEVVADGRVVAEAAGTVGPDGLFAASIRWEDSLAGKGWLAARCWSAAGAGRDPTRAHTSPVFLHADGRTAEQESDRAPLRQAVLRSREWIDGQGRFTNAKRKQQHLDRHGLALTRLATA